jgi:hypothetical protein
MFEPSRQHLAGLVARSAALPMLLSTAGVRADVANDTLETAEVTGNAGTRLPRRSHPVRNRARPGQQ